MTTNQPTNTYIRTHTENEKSLESLDQTARSPPAPVGYSECHHSTIGRKEGIEKTFAKIMLHLKNKGLLGKGEKGLHPGEQLSHRQCEC